MAKKIPIFEPLIIMDMRTGEKWVHPLFDNYCSFNTDGSDTSSGSFKMHIEFENGTMIFIGGKSSIINEFWRKNMKRDTDKYNQNIKCPFSGEMVKIDDILPEILECMMTEDVWVTEDKQFIFTEFGEKMSKLFTEQDWNYDHSPDIGLWHIEDEYGWDT